MLLDVKKVETWKATMEDHPGALAAELEVLARAGADVEFLIVRRLHEPTGKGIMFVSPLGGTAAAKASQMGFSKAEMQALRVEGPDEPGLAFAITRAIAAAGLNLRGVSASRQGPRFLMYLAFETEKDADRAIECLDRGV